MRDQPNDSADLCLVSTTPLPFFRCHFTVPVSRCRFRTSLPLPLRISVPNGTEFSYVIFTEQLSFTTAERRNGNGMVETGYYMERLKMQNLESNGVNDRPNTTINASFRKPNSVVICNLCRGPSFSRPCIFQPFDLVRLFLSCKYISPRLPRLHYRPSATVE